MSSLQGLRLCLPALGILLLYNPKLRKKRQAWRARLASLGRPYLAGIRLQQPPKGERKQGLFSLLPFSLCGQGSQRVRGGDGEFSKQHQPANGPKSGSLGECRPPSTATSTLNQAHLELPLLLRKREGAPSLFPDKGSWKTLGSSTLCTCEP